MARRLTTPSQTPRATSLRSIDISDQIAQQIRDMIARGTLSPGMHLIPSHLADQLAQMVARDTLAPGVALTNSGSHRNFSVSRMPIREALKLLMGEGVVLRDPNRGFFVAPLSSDEASQLYKLRHLLEAEILTTVEWPEAAQLGEMRMVKDRMAAALDQGNLTQWIYLSRDLHRSIFELSPHKLLVREAMRLWTLSDRYRSLLVSIHTVAAMTDAEHLIDALATGDRARLMAAFEEDRTLIEKTLAELLQVRGL